MLLLAWGRSRRPSSRPAPVRLPGASTVTSPQRSRPSPPFRAARSSSRLKPCVFISVPGPCRCPAPRSLHVAPGLVRSAALCPAAPAGRSPRPGPAGRPGRRGSGRVPRSGLPAVGGCAVGGGLPPGGPAGGGGPGGPSARTEFTPDPAHGSAAAGWSPVCPSRSGCRSRRPPSSPSSSARSAGAGSELAGSSTARAESGDTLWSLARGGRPGGGPAGRRRCHRREPNRPPRTSTCCPARCCKLP